MVFCMPFVTDTYNLCTYVFEVGHVFYLSFLFQIAQLSKKRISTCRMSGLKIKPADSRLEIKNLNVINKDKAIGMQLNFEN